MRSPNGRTWATDRGYICAYQPDHPRASAAGAVFQHILIAESALGKPLPLGAEIHHVDGNEGNNARSNLVICQDIFYHRLLHLRARILRAGGDPNTQRKCTTCKQLKLFAEFTKSNRRADRISYRCRACAKLLRQGYKRPKRVRARNAS